VSYDLSAWPELPTKVGDAGGLRVATFDLAEREAVDLFTASYVFGMGLRGYGRHRHDEVVAGAADLGHVLERVREIGRCQGPAIAYAHFYGATPTSAPAPAKRRGYVSPISGRPSSPSSFTSPSREP
jgi:hypothetical protein